MSELYNVAEATKRLLKRATIVREERPGSGDFIKVTDVEPIRLVTDDGYNFYVAYDDNGELLGKLVLLID